MIKITPKIQELIDAAAERAAERAVAKYRAGTFRDARKKWIPISRAAQQFGKGRTFFYDLIHAGKIRTCSTPGRGATGTNILINIDEISREMGIPC